MNLAEIVRPKEFSEIISNLHGQIQIPEGDEGEYKIDRGTYEINIIYTYTDNYSKIEINAIYSDGYEIYKDVTYFNAIHGVTPSPIFNLNKPLPKSSIHCSPALGIGLKVFQLEVVSIFEMIFLIIILSTFVYYFMDFIF